jgi:DNA-binding CsgD family transcriptional regulator
MLVAGLEALDLLNIGVAVTNSSRQLLFANHTAEQILIARDGLDVNAQGMLGSVNRSSNLSLRETMQQAALARADEEWADAALAVPRASGKRPLSLLVRPLRSGPWRSHAAGPAVLVFVWDPELPVRDIEARLRQLYGLTSCEARLANLLMEGKTLDDCCDQLEIRTSTARMHLGNLFAKTGVQRQGQLVSLLWKSVGMIRTQREISPLRSAISPDCTRIRGPVAVSRQWID